MHRTPSQRTVATQLSIPFSSSMAAAAQAAPEAQHRAAASSLSHVAAADGGAEDGTVDTTIDAEPAPAETHEAVTPAQQGQAAAA